MLLLVVVLFLANAVSVKRERDAKQAAETAINMASAIDRLRFQMMQNRLALDGYVLTGGPGPLGNFTRRRGSF